MRVFFDTNVIFSGLYAGASPAYPARLLRKVTAGDVGMVTSPGVFDELVRNLRRKAPGSLERLESFVAESSIEVVTEGSATERDHFYELGFGSDAPIVAAAIGADVDYLCTGDKRLLRRVRELAPGLHAVSPGDLLRLLE